MTDRHTSITNIGFGLAFLVVGLVLAGDAAGMYDVDVGLLAPLALVLLGLFLLGHGLLTGGGRGSDGEREAR